MLKTKALISVHIKANLLPSIPICLKFDHDHDCLKQVGYPNSYNCWVGEQLCIYILLFLVCFAILSLLSGNDAFWLRENKLWAKSILNNFFLALSFLLILGEQGGKNSKISVFVGCIYLNFERQSFVTLEMNLGLTNLFFSDFIFSNSWWTRWKYLKFQYFLWGNNQFIWIM